LVSKEDIDGNMSPPKKSILTNLQWSFDKIITIAHWTTDNILVVNDLDMSHSNLTGKCKFYVSQDINEDDILIENVECEKDANGNNTNRFKFSKQYNNVFLYGKEVNDFHTIDKNQIFALHHSAIQELSRKNDAKTSKITKLESKCAKLETDIRLIKAKLGL